MTLKYYNSYLNIAPSSPQQGYLNDLQQMIDQQFNNASDVYTIQEERTFGLQDWQDISVRITHVLPDTNTSDQKKSDDWRNIIFDNINHYYALGIRYQFDNNIWCTVQSDYYHKPTASAIIRRCDSTFKFYDDNHNLIEEPIMIDYDMRLTKFLFGKEIILPQGHIKIVMQKNDNSSKIKMDQRFLLSDTEVYKVDYINNFIRKNTYDKTSVPLIYMTLFKDQINPSIDDLTNGIANAFNDTYTISIDQGTSLSQSIGYTSTLTATVKDNDTIVTNQPITWISSTPTVGIIDNNGNFDLLTEGITTFTASLVNIPSVSDSMVCNVGSTPTIEENNIISPSVTSLLQGDIQSYSVKHYVNGVANNDTFTITASGSSSNHYNLNVIDGNNFIVGNINMDSVPLVVSCVNNRDGSSVSLSIELKGLW